MSLKQILLFSLMLLLGKSSSAQLPFEVFVGNERATLDLLFFRNFTPLNSTAAKKKGIFLFFHRTRASVDYRITSTQYLPQFGFTEAVSYSRENWKGFAPVGVVQVLSTGVYSKAGLQWAHLSKNMVLFTWLVAETKKESKLDYFLLFRYTPNITEHTKAFLQAESLNVLPTISSQSYAFTQRIRVGFDRYKYQAGLGFDFAQAGRNNYTSTKNIGIFLRHDF